MINKQILKCPREQTLKGIPYWSQVVAYIVHNHLLIDLACKLVYWVSISWTHTVQVIPFQFPQHPYLVQNKLSGIACTPRKGVDFLGFVVFSMVPSSSCLWKRKGPQGRVNVSCGEDGSSVSVWIWEWVLEKKAELLNWSLGLSKDGVTDRKNPLFKIAATSLTSTSCLFPRVLSQSHLDSTKKELGARRTLLRHSVMFDSLWAHEL